MRCAWEKLLSILPPTVARQLDTRDRQTAREIRLRLGAAPEINLGSTRRELFGAVSQEDLKYTLNLASKYSPWCAATLAQGYLTAPGGHRIGVCGEGIFRQGQTEGFRQVRSLCIRVARDFPGIGAGIEETSTLIVGSPGWGKTTLLRDLARQFSRQETVSVVDERGELFPEDFETGQHMDILTGLPKPQGVEMVLKTMGPAYIAVDEITSEADSLAVLQAASCGVRLLATVHGAGLSDLRQRPMYRRLLEAGVFRQILVLSRDQSYRRERVTI